MRPGRRGAPYEVRTRSPIRATRQETTTWQPQAHTRRPSRTAAETASRAVQRPRMRAIVQAKYGSADVLRVDEIDRPDREQRGPDPTPRCRARPRHVASDGGSGVPDAHHGLRLFADRSTPFPGLDVAGTVAATGADVSRFNVGDEVFGISQGSFAQYACASEDKLARKPASLSFDQAAVLGVSGLTALQALRDAGRIEAGQHVLIVVPRWVSARSPYRSPRPSRRGHRRGAARQSSTSFDPSVLTTSSTTPETTSRTARRATT